MKYPSREHENKDSDCSDTEFQGYIWAVELGREELHIVRSEALTAESMKVSVWLETASIFRIEVSDHHDAGSK
jgi:hypothetical protein